MTDLLTPTQLFDPYANGIASGVQDLFTPFLGQPARQPNINHHNNKSHAKWNMPEAYIGQSIDLGQTVEDAVLTAKWDFWTQIILPYYRTEDITISWAQWDNNAHYMGITPHQTASKVVTQKHTIRRASIIRRGIAAEFENDFVATVMGRASVLAAIGQIVRAFQETANMEVLMALLNCHKYQHKMFQEAGIMSYGELHTMLDRQAARWMCAQKGDFGLERLNVLIDEELQAVKGRADTWILSADVSNYVRTVHEAKTYYDKGGQEAVDRINGRVNPRKLAGAGTMGVTSAIEPFGMVGDCNVYLARSYTVDPNTHLDLLSRTVEIGVYNTMIDNTRDYTKYQTVGRHIRVYNNTRDDWAEITLVDAIRNCGVWDANGNLSALALQRSGNASDPSNVLNDDYDFLSYKGADGKRVNIRFFGDMAPGFVLPEHFIDAARALQTAAGVMPEVFGETSVTSDPKTSVYKLSKTQEAHAFSTFAVKLRQMLGDENTMFPHGITAESVAAFFTSSTHDLIAPTAAVGAGAAGATALPEDLVQGFLTDMVGAAVPEAHKQKVQDIASNASAPWTERAAQIKELVLAHRAEDPKIAKDLPKTQDVDKWYNGIVKTFKDRAAKVAAAAGTAASKRSTGADLHLLPTGAPMPAGFTLVHSARNDDIMARMQAVGTGSAGVPAGETDAGAPGGRTGGTISRAQAAKSSADNMDNNLKAIHKAFAEASLKPWAKLYAGIAFRRDTLVALAKANVPVLLGFLLMRPHCTYETRFGIKCAAGGQTGITAYGHTNMMLASEAARKVGLMHFTAYMAAVVTNPRNVYVAEDIFCKKYLGGMGVTWWNAADYKRAGKRTARDFICAPLPPSRRQIERKIDTRGRWYTHLDMGLLSEEEFNEPLYEGAQRICHLFGLRDAARKNASSNRARTAYNTVLHAGAQWAYNTTSHQFDDFTVEAGHFSCYVYPGCGRVRNGESVLLEKPIYGNRH